MVCDFSYGDVITLDLAVRSHNSYIIILKLYNNSEAMGISVVYIAW